jgi:superfamily II DNA or RNA helicase
VNVGQFTLRPHQIRAIEESRALLARLKVRDKPLRLVICAPCGSGKTVISAAIIKAAIDKGSKCVFVAHGRQLIYQKSKTLERCNIPHAVLMSGEDDAWYQSAVTVCSKDTLWARVHRSQRLAPIDADLWIVDEAHEAMGDTWMQLLPKDKPVIGMTATPAKADGRGLGAFYQGLVVAARYGELIDSGMIVDVRCFAPWSVDTRGLKRKDGDWSWEEVARRLGGKELVGSVVDEWKRHGENRPTACYASSVPHSIALCDEFNQRGIRAVHVDADTPQEEREAAYLGVREGTIKIICNMGVLTVGWDEPVVSCEIMAFSTASLIKYLQVAGRVLRPHPGKTNAILIDHGDNISRHGWPTDDRAWAIDAGQTIEERERTARLSGKREPICCYNCGALRQFGGTCPNCGAHKVRRGIPVMNLDGTLTELKRKTVKKKAAVDDHQKLWFKCLGIAANKYGSVDMAMSLFMKMSGKYPPAHLHPMPPKHKWGVRVRSLYPGFVRKRKGQWTKK